MIGLCGVKPLTARSQKSVLSTGISTRSVSSCVRSRCAGRHYAARFDCTSTVLVFVLGALICSIVEFVTGGCLQIIFHARLWDYSKHRFNLYGRVCLLNTNVLDY